MISEEDLNAGLPPLGGHLSPSVRDVVLDENLDMPVSVETLQEILAGFQQQMNHNFQQQMNTTLQEEIRRIMLTYGAGTTTTTLGGHVIRNPNVNLGLDRINRLPLRSNVWRVGESLRQAGNRLVNSPTRRKTRSETIFPCVSSDEKTYHGPIYQRQDEFTRKSHGNQSGDRKIMRLSQNYQILVLHQSWRTVLSTPLHEARVE